MEDKIDWDNSLNHSLGVAFESTGLGFDLSGDWQTRTVARTFKHPVDPRETSIQRIEMDNIGACTRDSVYIFRSP